MSVIINTSATSVSTKSSSGPDFVTLHYAHSIFLRDKMRARTESTTKSQKEFNDLGKLPSLKRYTNVNRKELNNLDELSLTVLT